MIIIVSLRIMRQIELTDSQFVTMLKLVYIGEWIVNGYKISGDTNPKYFMFMKIMLRYADRFGYKNLVCTSEDEISPSDEMGSDPEIRSFIASYEEASFWDELCAHLATRDALRIYGKKLWRLWTKWNASKLSCALKINTESILEPMA